jgi:hypothetical protein
MSEIDKIISESEAAKRQRREDEMNAQRDAPAKAQLLTRKTHVEIVAALKELLPEGTGPISDMASDGSAESFVMKSGQFGVQFRIKTPYRPGAHPEITIRAFFKGNREKLHVRYAPDGNYSSLLDQVKTVAARLSRQ